MKKISALMWFRRDLRTSDNAALYHALKFAEQTRGSVACAFVFDTDILQHLPPHDRRIVFIHASLQDLDTQLQDLSKGAAKLIVKHGKAIDEVVQLAAQLDVQAVFANHDYEPEAIRRDEQVAESLRLMGIGFETFKDQVIFEKNEVLTQADKPYTVFTPYKNAWLKKLSAERADFYLKPYPVEKYAHALQLAVHLPSELVQPVSLIDIGFADAALERVKVPTGSPGARQLLTDFLLRIDKYQEARDFPAIKGPSYLSVHLRFGTVSIRELAREAYARKGNSGADTWLSELIWRDFYFSILHHFPHAATRAFKPDYDRIEWERGEAAKAQFKAWCTGQTGYPLVDAAMRQLNQTGYMHNRLRMVVASFLTKDLGIDYRWGEAYFAAELLDFDLSANNGGWQWAASSGCDAQPYFRIFNPITQSERFDALGKFIRRYVPELQGLADKQIHAPWLVDQLVLAQQGIVLGETYPFPIVDHTNARAQTLQRYAVVKSSAT